VVLVATTAAIVALTTVSQAQRRGRNDNSSFGAPIATNTVVDNPDAYYGKLVTISAGVEEVVSRTAFVIDQRKAVNAAAVKAIGKPILVVAPYLSGALDDKSYLLVRGEIVKLDAIAMARMASEYKVDLSPEVSEKYKGRPVLLASSVLTSTYTEIGRKPIPPPTPDDVALTAAMKTIAPAFAALRAAADESKTAVVAESAATLKPAFAQAAKVFEDVRQSAAVERVREAGLQLGSIESASAAGNWEAARASAAALNQTCQNCHAALRERQDDGTFRLKMVAP
jgi:hypothetical protein